MKKIVLVSRIILGLVMLVFGVNGLMMFLLGKGFIPAPPPSPEMMTIMTGFMATKYLMIMVKALEVIAGLFLLSGFFINAGLTMLGPIMVNIFCIHFFVEPSGLPVAIVFCVLYLIVLISQWGDFKQLVKV